MHFYQFVSDQVENLAPFGTEDGKGMIVPRLSDWLAGAELLGIDPDARLPIIRAARELHAGVQGRVPETAYALHTMDPETLTPESVDG